MRLTIIVMGDLPRSPRTLNHLTSALGAGIDVDAVCQLESALPLDLEQHPGLRIFSAPKPANRRHKLSPRLFLGYTAFRLMWQTLWLFTTLLFQVRKPDWILLQNPPAIPVLMIASFVARRRRSRLIIDWHNLGFSLLALKIGSKHPLCRWAQKHELGYGRRADRHLCVSDTMGDWLLQQGMTPVTVFHDHPADLFLQSATAKREDLLYRLHKILPEDIFTILAQPTESRPGILISSSSWTADEDFSLLLDGLRYCDNKLASRLEGPSLLVLLTGQGSGRSTFERLLADNPLNNIHIATLWLSHDLYPSLLTLADLGLSLHRSSSGLDIPMKIYDMLAAGLPVCALDYGIPLQEILTPEQDSLLFNDASELATAVTTLFDDRGTPTKALRKMRSSVPSPPPWSEAWREQILPLFRYRP